MWISILFLYKKMNKRLIKVRKLMLSGVVWKALKKNSRKFIQGNKKGREKI